MVMGQPDLGTALTYLPIALVGLFLGGVRWKQAAVVVLLAGLAMPLAWHHMKDYQKQRLTSFMAPDADPRGAGYHVKQSKIAVGSGGIWGSNSGSQTRQGFLPEPHTDFIFAAFSEEHGFVGAMAVLLLYFIVLMRLTQNAQTAPDRAGTFIVMGVVAVLTFHILVNIGMVVGFMPVTGIPLPLMSYGGSSVLFMFLALGMVMNVRMRRFVNSSHSIDASISRTRMSAPHGNLLLQFTKRRMPTVITIPNARNLNSTADTPATHRSNR